MSIRIYLLSFLLLLTLADASSQNQRRVPNIAVGVNRTTADSLLMSHFNIGLLGNVDALHGVQTSLFTSVHARRCAVFSCLESPMLAVPSMECNCPVLAMSAAPLCVVFRLVASLISPWV